MCKRVLNVGNCGPDNRAITAMLGRHFTAEVVSVDNASQAMEQLRNQAFDLVLVNRILDRDGSDGLKVIQQIKTAPDTRDTPVMMITNFPDHQLRAQEAGALEGFGKQALQDLETRAKLAPLLS